MRPEKLELQYFGPYEHTVIDFEQFRKRPLFLVGGNTGAGKTTIFDAMCYALFGQTTNDRDRSAVELRSDFAPADQETRVVFTFAHQGQRYRITRRPKQTLRGRRGKLVDHVQKVSLVYPLASDHPHEITKISAAERFITQLLNMTRDQFKQIVLLPQGKFRQFLDSDSDAKNKLLSDLFQTQHYGAWAEKLKERLKAQRTTITDRQNRLQAKKETVADLDAQLSNGEWLTAARQLAGQLASQLTALTEKEAGEQAAAKKLTAQLQAGRELRQNIQDLQETNEKIHQLQKQAAAVDRLRSRVADLHWFREHQAAYQRYTDACTGLKQAQQEAARLAGQLAGLQAQEKQSQQAVDRLNGQQEQMAAVNDQARDLTAKLPLFAAVDDLRKTAATAKKQQGKLAALNQQADQAVTEHTSQLQAVRQQLISREELAARQTQLEQARNSYRDLQAAGKQLKADQSALTAERDRCRQLQAQLTKEKTAADQAAVRLADQRDSYARHQIALLARDLKPGQPCPVCGATDHPQPAVIEDSAAIVTADQVKQAAAAAQQAHDRYRHCALQVQQSNDQAAKLRDQVAADQQMVAGQLGQAELPAGWERAIDLRGASLAQKQARFKAVQESTDKQEQQIQALQTQLAADREQSQAAGEQLQAAAQKAVEAQTRLAEKQGSLPADFTNAAAAKAQAAAWTKQFTDYTARLSQAQEQLAAQTREIAVIRNSQAQKEEQINDLTDRQSQFHDQLTAALDHYQPRLTWGFWERAMSALPDLPGMEQQLAAYDNQLRDLRQESQRLTTAIAGRPEPDLRGLQDQLAEQEQQVQASQRQIGQVQARQTQLTATITDVKKMVEKLDQADQQLTELQTLTDVMTGNTENHLSLERYVLQAYFKDVLQAANVQLDRLTNGRYQFELAQESHGAGNKWTGLEINVYDDNAGCARSARTLSGGESFIASLALALALCQIIQEQSGGIQIDALFIDEGFGSLDQEALADALRTLEELEGHRMIGIISHVTELEEQIPDQLRVESRDGRSTVSYRHEI